MGGDEFEGKYMHDGARVLHRDKQVSRAFAALVSVPGLAFFVLGLMIPIRNAFAPHPMPWGGAALALFLMTALAALYMAIAVGLAVLRVVVTEKAVHVKYGLWGPKIPLDAITSTRVIDYDWLKYGGFGIRRSLRDGSYAYVRGRGKVVEVKYTSKDGAEQTVVVGASDANALRDQIDKARALSTGAAAVAQAKRARVETSNETKEMTPEEKQRLAEAEAETEALLATEGAEEAEKRA